MMKLAVVFIAVAVASAACGPVADRNAEIELELSKNECQRSRIKAHNEMSPLFHQIFKQEISEDLKNALLAAYEEAQSAYNDLADDIKRVQSMNITNGIYTVFGTEIHCSENFARYIARISSDLRDVFKENGIVADSYDVEFAAKKLELVKKECRLSIFKAGRELTQKYYGISPRGDEIYRAIVEGSKKFDALRKDVMEVKSMEAVDGFYTALGMPIHCNKDFAEKVIQNSNEVLSVFKQQGFF